MKGKMVRSKENSNHINKTLKKLATIRKTNRINHQRNIYIMVGAEE